VTVGRGSRRGLWTWLVAGAGALAVGVTAVVMLNGPKTPAPPPPDTTLPSVAIISPIPNAPVSGQVHIIATASDNVGVVAVRIKVDGAQVGAELTSPPYEVPWESTAVANTRHEISVEAKDAAGNTGKNNIIVTTQNEPPVSAGAGGRPGAQTQGTQTAGRGHVGDPAANAEQLAALCKKIEGLLDDEKYDQVLKEAEAGLKVFPGDDKLTAFKKLANKRLGRGGGWLD